MERSLSAQVMRLPSSFSLWPWPSFTPFHLVNFAFLHHNHPLEAWLKAWSCEILLPKVTRTSSLLFTSQTLGVWWFISWCSWDGIFLGIGFEWFCSMKVVHEGFVSMLGFVISIFHEVVKISWEKLGFWKFSVLINNMWLGCKVLKGNVVFEPLGEREWCCMVSF